MIQGALFFNASRVGRHGAGGNASDIGVVAAGRHPENDPVIFEHRCDDRDIRKMTAAGGRVIGNQHVTGLEVVRLAPDLLLDRLTHGPQMDRQMGGIGHQFAVGTKQRTRKIQPLFDIGGNRRFLKHTAHLFGNGHEQVAENRQLDGDPTSTPIDRPEPLPNEISTSP